MLQFIVEASLRNRVVVVVLAAILLVAGMYATWHAQLDVFPNFAPPMVVVQTQAPGLSTGEVEQLVTLPIEMALSGMPRLETLRSQSIQGLSAVTVIFQDGTDIFRARQQVAERVGEVAPQLPNDVEIPRLAPLVAPTGRMLTVGFTSDKLSSLQLRDRVQWFIRPRVLAIKGVAQVTLFGGGVRQFQVQIDPEALAARNLTMTEVLAATREASGIRGAGFIENDNQRMVLRTEGQVYSAAALGGAAIETASGTPVRLRDIGTVVEAAEPKYGDATIEGKPGVLLILYKQLDGDTHEITRRVEEELARLTPGLAREGIVYHPALLRQATVIKQAVDNVAHSLLVGAGLVTIVLFLFLFDLRTALISLSAIPLSLLGAILVLWTFGVSLNTLTLGGLAIAVGEVVDDAIIDVENILRRLRENASLSQPKSRLAVVLEASLEVRSAVVYATLIVVLVFVPVFFMTGLQGRLFAPLGHAYVLAVLASLGVALTITPALALMLLKPNQQRKAPPLVKLLQGKYGALLARLHPHLTEVVVVTCALIALAVWQGSRFGGEFLPELRENHFVVHMRGVPGGSLPHSVAMGNRVTAALKKIPAVRTVSQQIGRAELGEDTWGVEYSEIEVDLQPLAAKDISRVRDEIRTTLADMPGFSFMVLPYLSERIMETLTGSTADVSIKVYGDDLLKLDEIARKIEQLVATVPGSGEARADIQTGVPELVIRVRSEAAARYGLRNTEILEAVHAAYQGAKVGQVYEGNRIVNVVVVLDPRARQDPQAVGKLWLAVDPARGESPQALGDSGTETIADTLPGAEMKEHRIPLSEVADLFFSDGRRLIAHEGGLRRQVVTCNVHSRDVESFVTELQRKLQDVELPERFAIAVEGEHLAKQTAQRELLLLGSAIGIGVVLLLWMALGAVRPLVLVLTNLPFAFVGGVAAVAFAGGVLDVGSLIGFVTLFGITVRNGIMMISHWQHLHGQEGVPWGPELVFRGAQERLVPVLITALVTGLGLLPIALGSGEAGREVEGPMAWVILGGLATSTALNLLVLPILFLRWGVADAGSDASSRAKPS
jgi:CzcA family heavy metal efflux pump